MSDAAVNTDSIQELTARLVGKYGKLWPLQTFNACNPLVAYESRPFSQALQQASLDLGFSMEEARQVLKALFAKQAFSWAHLEQVLDESTTELDLAHSIEGFHPTITYRDLLHHELEAFLSEGTTQSTARVSAQELALVSQQTFSDWFGLAQQPVQPLNSVQTLWLNEQVTKWLAAYLDEGQAIWSMPNQDLPFHQSWARLIVHDESLSDGLRGSLIGLLDALALKTAHNPSAALAALCQQAGWSLTEVERLIRYHLQQLPGWVGYLRYRQEQQPGRENLLLEYLLVRLSYHFSCVQSGWQASSQPEAQPLDSDSLQRLALLLKRVGCLSQPALTALTDLQRETLRNYLQTVDAAQVLIVMIRALENAQNRSLVAQLTQQFQAHRQQPVRAIQAEADAQAVFCIDVRSEPYRKLLEGLGNIETYGFAGFFGLPIQKVAYASQEPVPLCPILLQPQYTIPEAPSPFLAENPIGRLLRQVIPLRHQWIYSLKKIKRDTFATFSYVESFGLVHAVTLLKDSFMAAPLGRFWQSVLKPLRPLLGLLPRLDAPSDPQSAIPVGIPVSQQAEMAKAILRLMGLRQPLAEFVIMCGHNARSRNNPYASALDCGACGANGGGFNALVLCQMLNHPDVREALILSGWKIPEHTRFIAAEHNTTTDEVLFLNEEVIPSQQQERFLAVKRTFVQATRLNSLARQARVNTPGFTPHAQQAEALSFDWSQTRPEWGLSKNQGFLICNRQAIKTLDLEGRCFLHSYDWQSDEDGSTLTTIMTAPMVVGAWINLQYGFSTLDQKRFGSGKKYLHNVVGLFGAYVGNSSDLQVGLPYESLFDNDGSPYHYPQRLMVCIEAPLSRVQDIIAANPAVHNLVHHQWIRMSVFDPTDGRAYQFAQGAWQTLPVEQSARVA